MSVHAEPIFDSLPTSSDGHDRLSFTSVVPVLHCSVCDGNVKAFSDGGNTVFKVDGRFLQKSGISSQACRREQFLPKSNCFHEFAVDGTHETSMFRGCGVVGPLVPSQ